jgi:hypothetical protein
MQLHHACLTSPGGGLHIKRTSPLPPPQPLLVTYQPPMDPAPQTPALFTRLLAPKPHPPPKHSPHHVATLPLCMLHLRVATAKHKLQHPHMQSGPVLRWGQESETSYHKGEGRGAVQPPKSQSKSARKGRRRQKRERGQKRANVRLLIPQFSSRGVPCSHPQSCTVGALMSTPQHSASSLMQLMPCTQKTSSTKTSTQQGAGGVLGPGPHVCKRCKHAARHQHRSPP